VVSQDYFRLVEVDKRTKLDNVQVLHTKLHQQLHNGGGEDSIFELLQSLKDIPLIDNLPSENRKRGIQASQIDKEAQKEVKQKLESATANNLIRSSKRRRVQFGNGGVGDISITMETEDYEEDGDFADDSPVKIAGRATNLPEFLQNSRVRTAEDIMRESSTVIGIAVGGDGIGDAIVVDQAATALTAATNTKIDARGDIAASSSAIIGVAADAIATATASSTATTDSGSVVAATAESKEVDEGTVKVEVAGEVAADEDLDDIDWEEG
jgi:hypothetical protein